jgi:uncharacterized protein
MKILITGGTGFIGRTLCPALIAAGHSLTIFSRYPGRVNTTYGNKVVALSAMKTLSVSHEFDAIINLSGAPIFGELWSDERKKTLLQTRMDITQDLVHFIAKAEIKPEVFLSGSGIGFYGDRSDRILDESSPAHGDNFSQQLCAQWEAEAEKAKEHGVRVCQLRTGLVLGKDGGFLKPLILPFKLGLGGRMGSGTQWMPWIHLDDHVAICQMLLENTELEGKINLTAPHPVINREFTRILARTLRRPAFLPLPTWALKMLLGEMSELLLNSQRVVPKRLLDANYPFKFSELDAAMRDVLQH